MSVTESLPPIGLPPLHNVGLCFAHQWRPAAPTRLGHQPCVIRLQVVGNLRRPIRPLDSWLQPCPPFCRQPAVGGVRQLMPTVSSGDRFGWIAKLEGSSRHGLLCAHVGRSRPPGRNSNADVRPSVVVAAQMCAAGGLRSVRFWGVESEIDHSSGGLVWPEAERQVSAVPVRKQTLVRQAIK